MLSQRTPVGIVSQTLGMGSDTLDPDEEERRKKLMEQQQARVGGLVSNAVLGQGGFGSN